MIPYCVTLPVELLTTTAGPGSDRGLSCSGLLGSADRFKSSLYNAIKVKPNLYSHSRQGQTLTFI